MPVALPACCPTSSLGSLRHHHHDAALDDHVQKENLHLVVVFLGGVTLHEGQVHKAVETNCKEYDL